MQGLRQRRVQLTACAPAGVLTRADPAHQAQKSPLTAREPNTPCTLGQLRIPLTARHGAPPGVLTRQTAHPDGLCANHLGLQHRLLTNGTDGLCARGY